MELDKSWNKKASEICIEPKDKDYYDVYLQGASDFQQRAIEELNILLKVSKEATVDITGIDKAFDAAIKLSIKIIKQLKAE